MKIEKPEERFMTRHDKTCSKAILAAEFKNILENPVIHNGKKYFHNAFLHCSKTEEEIWLSKDGIIRCKHFSKSICEKIGEICINSEYNDDTTMKKNNSKF